MIQLYNDDCINRMDKLIEEGVKVDLTVTSSPYDNLRTYKDSLEWNENIWKQVIEKLYEITTSGGVVVWVVGDATIKGSETGTSFKQALYAKECGFNLHDTMIYSKPNAMPLTHNRYDPMFEYMFVWSKGKPKTFNPIKEETIHHGKVNKRELEQKMKSIQTHQSRCRNEHTVVKKYKYKKIYGNIWSVWKRIKKQTSIPHHFQKN